MYPSVLNTLGRRSIVKQGTLDYFCLPGRLKYFVNMRVLKLNMSYLRKKYTVFY